jgi:Zn-dependent peptidase ImmA (M78 family)
MAIEPFLTPRAGPFQPSRMLAARLRRGFTVNALAEAMGLNRRNVHRHDVGQFAPNTDHLRAAARALCFPERFFLGGDIGEWSPDRASLRSSSRLSARQRDIALGSAALAIAFNSEIERLYALPEPVVPDLSDHRNPEQVPYSLRRRWNLDQGPIASVIQLLESKGVRVFSLPADAIAADTFSLWWRDRPIMLLNTAKHADELRLDLAHELGHLVLHRHGAPANPKAQLAASAFASAFLMPAAAMRQEARRPFGTDQLMSLAGKWGTPPAALAHRLHKLGFLSDWQHRMLRDQIAEQRILTEEQRDSAREKSHLLQSVFASLGARGVTKHKIASTVHIYPKDLDELTFGLALQPSDVSKVPTDPLRPRLTVVPSER